MLAIIGHGHVGKQVAELFKKEEIRLFDPLIIRGYTKEQINEADIGIVCVPTNMGDDGRCDTSIVEEVVGWLETPIILIKSTIPPGTCDELKKKTGKRIIFSPEYVGESKYSHSYWDNMADAPFNIFGGDKEDIKPVLDLFMKYCGPEKTYVQCTTKEAELTKYFENTFFAAKVTIVNEFYDICEALDIDWDTVRELWLLDPRINRMHTAVFKDNRGYGGKCYPKDVQALIKFSQLAGYTPEVIKKVDEVNYDFNNNN